MTRKTVASLESTVAVLSQRLEEAKESLSLERSRVISAEKAAEELGRRLTEAERDRDRLQGYVDRIREQERPRTFTVQLTGNEYEDGQRLRETFYSQQCGYQPEPPPGYRYR